MLRFGWLGEIYFRRRVESPSGARRCVRRAEVLVGLAKHAPSGVKVMTLKNTKTLITSLSPRRRFFRLFSFEIRRRVGKPLSHFHGCPLTSFVICDCRIGATRPAPQGRPRVTRSFDRIINIIHVSPVHSMKLSSTFHSFIRSIYY